MSQAHIEQFYGKALKDPALINKIATGTKSPDDFVRNAVKEGKNQGFDFSYEEADAWIRNQQKIKASGELSDSQLEGVAGGKGTSNNTTSANLQAQANTDSNTAFDSSQSLGTQITSGLKGGFEQIGAWLTSW
jgi:predicted ribosomally synthesized peptide with nif11-like leader